MTKRTLLISIPVVALVLNGVGYLIVSKVRAPATKPTTTATLHRPPAAAGVPGTAQGEALPAAAPPAAQMSGASRATEAQALAHRATGLAALEAGDYKKALANFTVARDLLGEKAQVDELLRVTEQLRSRPANARSPSDDSRSRGAGATTAVLGGSRSSARGSARRAAVVREEGPAETSQTQAAAQSGQSGQSGQGGPGGTGLLIVTTTPRGLLVQVDDTAVDLTPMRTKVRPGSHRVALLDGDRKVYETTMDVRDGSIATLQKDLSAEQAGEPARPAVLAPPSSREQSQATVTPMDSSDTGQPNPSVGASTRAPAAFTTPRPIAGGQTPSLSGDGTGALSISSPGLYGVVWINGRPRGYPPLEVRNLPSGPVKIEVRVNGVQKRSSTVVVRAGSTTPVRIQSQEPSP